MKPRLRWAEHFGRYTPMTWRWCGSSPTRRAWRRASCAAGWNRERDRGMFPDHGMGCRPRMPSGSGCGRSIEREPFDAADLEKGRERLRAAFRAGAAREGTPGAVRAFRARVPRDEEIRAAGRSGRWTLAETSLPTSGSCTSASTTCLWNQRSDESGRAASYQ
jgi:hypothetical protein